VPDELTSTVPVALDEVDPDDPAFSKPEGPVPRLPTPAALTRPLLAFQEEGLGWMVANEASPVQGGILADEMGMGRGLASLPCVSPYDIRGSSTPGGVRLFTMTILADINRTVFQLLNNVSGEKCHQPYVRARRYRPSR
jgi:hypothetical protein